MPVPPYQDGRIYVIEFSSGVVKVGCTRKPAGRFDNHEKAARVHGATITHCWLSPIHDGYKANEDKLISFCLKHFGPPIVGHEHFKPARFTAVRSYAATLDFPLEDPPIDQNNLRGALDQLQGEIRSAAALSKYLGQEATNEAVFHATQRLMRLMPSAWADTDPNACLRYLIARGASADVATRVEGFEISVRALFALTYQRDPETFAELAEYMDAHHDRPAVLV